MKKALLVISFGTSYQNVLEENILPVEEALKKAYPSYDFYRAFTSRFIVKKLKKEGFEVKLEKDMLSELIEMGYEEIWVQPTHMIPGHEFEDKIKVLESVSPVVKVGQPLLTGARDYEKMANVLNQEYDLENLKNPLVFMGHGTDHRANEHYVRLATYLNSNYPLVFLAGVEGNWCFQDILERIKEDGFSTIALAPLMIVAGDHAKNDMAGQEEDSWKSLAQALGFEVQLHMQGLGSFSGIHQLIIDKMKG